MSKRYYHIIVFVLAALLLSFLMPRTHKFEYDYHQGRPWQSETLIAEFDFPIYKSQEELLKESSESDTEIIPYYKYSEEATARMISSAEAIKFDDPKVRSAVLNTLRRVCLQGIMSDEKPTRKGNYSEALVYVQKDKRAAKYPVAELYRQSEVRGKLLSELTASPSLVEVNVDSLLRAVGIYDLIQPNLTFDAQTTSLVSSESRPEVSPTQGYVSAGTVIVSEGEIITADIKQMLDSYKKEYEINMGSSMPRIGTFFGNLLVALALASIWMIVIIIVAPEIFGSLRKLLYVVFVLLLMAVLVLTVGRDDIPQRYMFMLPLTLGIYYLQPFFRDRFVVPMFLVSLLPLLICPHNGAVLYVIFAHGGLCTAILYHRYNKGGEQFVPVVVTYGAMLLTYLAFRLLSAFSGPVWMDLLFMLVGCVLSVALSQVSFVFEKVFGLLSPTTLDQLTDAGNSLLHELETKAPGTFQHSLQVMSMCETVARATGADVHLVRAGAMYHDIGKMMNPQCFVENESLISTDSNVKYHSELSPEQSAQSIIKHVTDGVDIATSSKLPHAVREFILTHHGTSCTQFFYTQYLNAGGDPARRPEFCYPGHKPQTKEQVILMICDSIEAASRSLSEHTPEAISKLVEDIVAGKIADGQFDDAEVTLRDLQIIKDTLKSNIAQVNHDRVKYPKLKRRK